MVQLGLEHAVRVGPTVVERLVLPPGVGVRVEATDSRTITVGVGINQHGDGQDVLAAVAGSLRASRLRVPDVLVKAISDGHGGLLHLARDQILDLLGASVLERGQAVDRHRDRILRPREEGSSDPIGGRHVKHVVALVGAKRTVLAVEQVDLKALAAADLHAALGLQFIEHRVAGEHSILNDVLLVDVHGGMGKQPIHIHGTRCT